MSIIPGHISSLYKNYPVFLWVEDEETRAYLDAAWNHDNTIGFLIAGGSENIAAVVHAAHKDGLTHVFGLRDRDFGDTNRLRWNEPGQTIFTLDSFELENLLLDASAMHACDLNTTTKSARDFDHEMKAIAGKLDWWMACRRTIVSFRNSIGTDFIEHPTRSSVLTQAHALGAITTSSWWTTTRPTLQNQLDEARAQSELQRHHQNCSYELHNGDAWKRSFSGKEVLVEMRSHVWTKKHQKDPEGRINFYQAIATAQRKSKTIPQEVTDLRLAVRARVGL